MAAPEAKKQDESGPPKSGIATTIAFASLLTVAVTAAINFRMLPPSAFWICALGFVAVAFVFVLPWLRVVARWLQTFVRARRVRLRYRTPLLALGSALRDIAGSYTFSAGNILTAAVNQELMGIHSAAAHRVTVAALYSWMDQLLRFMQREHLGDVEFVSHANRWLQDYIRTCEGIASEIRERARSPSVKPEMFASVVRDWNEIRSRANALADEFKSLARNIGIDGRQIGTSLYLPSVPDIKD